MAPMCVHVIAPTGVSRFYALTSLIARSFMLNKINVFFFLHTTQIYKQDKRPCEARVVGGDQTPMKGNERQ